MKEEQLKLNSECNKKKTPKMKITKTQKERRNEKKEIYNKFLMRKKFQAEKKESVRK